jgi:uncharacterized protein (TIGR02147 family)
MGSLFEYHDYREFLNSYYTERKRLKAHISYRMMGKHIGVDASYLVKVLRGDVHLKETTIPDIIKFCNLTPKESDFFEALFYFTKAKNEKEIQHYYETMQSIRGVDALTLKTAQYEFYNKWYYSALWALLRVEPCMNHKSLGKKLVPKISDTQAKDALTLLEKLELISKDDSGYFRTTDRHLKSGVPIYPEAIKKFHSQMISLADDALYTISRNERDISAMTVALDDDCIEDIKDILQTTREKIRARVDEVTHPTQVIQTNFQMFPVAYVRGPDA